MIRWATRIFFACAALFVVAYLGDWAVYRFRGQPMDSVTVSRMLAVPLKGGKQEFDDQGSLNVPCARALFPQGALAPCWQLRRNANQTTKL